MPSEDKTRAHPIVYGLRDYGTHVTKAECKLISNSIKNELGTIKKALVGEDLRGGIVKDIVEIKTSLNHLKNNPSNNRSKKWWLAIVVALLGGGGIISELIKRLSG